MDRNTALKKLQNLIGNDLVTLASQYGVTIWKGQKKNKGWAGHVIERYLGLPLNSAQSPNFGSWELKIIPLKKLRDGTITIKETMAITMIDEYHVINNDFSRSHLLTKLQKIVVCTRLFIDQNESSSPFMGVFAFDLCGQIYSQIEKDYQAIRNCIKNNGFNALSGKMGTLVQPRTKGPGHGSTSRAFYARKELLKIILNLSS